MSSWRDSSPRCRDRWRPCYYTFNILTESSRTRTADHLLYQTLPHKTNTGSAPYCPQKLALGNEGQLLQPRAAKTTPSVQTTANGAHPPAHTFLPMKILINALGCALPLSPPTAPWHALVLLHRGWLLLPETCEYIYSPMAIISVYIIPHRNKIILGTEFRMPSPKGLPRRNPAVRG